jgi:winged helix DNA-binding protein
VPRRSSSPSSKAAERARAQLLHRPRGVDVVSHLLAVQAQDARMLPWALKARGGSADGCVITWLMRSTLHLVRVEDVRWLLALTEPRQRAGNARRLKQLGVDGVAERAVREIARALEDGPLDRRALAARLTVPTDGQRIAHLVHRAALDGVIALDMERRFVLLDDVAPPRRAGDLGARFAASRPGAGPEDLARWSGLPLSSCRAALRDVPAPQPRRGELGTSFIPAYDELLVSWIDRSPTVPPEHQATVYRGGVIRAVVLEEGVAVGTWRLRGGEVSAEAFSASP